MASRSEFQTKPDVGDILVVIRKWPPLFAHLSHQPYLLNCSLGTSTSRPYFPINKAAVYMHTFADHLWQR